MRADSEDEAGFTLIELMISLALFALIAVAGLALVDSVLGVRGRTEVRMDRLADMQRMMFVLASDVEQVADGDIVGDRAGVSFRRSAAGFGGPPVEVRYAVVAGTLVRTAGRSPQTLLDGVTGARWRFLDLRWEASWPPNAESRERWPRAIELELRTSGAPGGVLRRVVALPARPKTK